MTNELYEKLTALQWLLHRQQLRGWAENGPMADTTRGQGRILAVLKLRDGVSTRDLSYLLGIRVSSLNELLSKLESGGFVVREQSEQDKRVMLVKLTEKGRDEQQPVQSDFDDIFTCLSDEEQETLGNYLDRILEALHSSVGDDDESMYDRIEALRSHFGDMDGFFQEHGHEFPRGLGLAYGMRRGPGPDHMHRGPGPGHMHRGPGPDREY